MESGARCSGYWVVVGGGPCCPQAASPHLTVSAITDLNLSQEEARWPWVLTLAWVASVPLSVNGDDNALKV